MGCCDSKNQQCEPKDDLTRMKYATKKVQNKIDRCKAPERLGLSIHEKMGLMQQGSGRSILEKKDLQEPAAPQLLLEEERPSVRTNSQTNSHHNQSS